jgi:hypothetical protein
MNIFDSLINNPIASGIVYSSMIGWVGYQIKDIPMKIINFVKPLITYNILMPDEGGSKTYMAMDKLTAKYKPLFNNMLMNNNFEVPQEVWKEERLTDTGRVFKMTLFKKNNE